MMDFEAILNFFENYPEAKTYLNKLDLDNLYTLFMTKTNLLHATEPQQRDLISCLTYLLLKSGIDPIKYLTVIPKNYMYRLDVGPSKLTINSNINIIGDAAFLSCTNLKNIVVNGVNSIGSMAFQNCINLKSVVIDNVDEIKAYAFADCEKLQNISISDSTTYIEYAAFNNCKSLVEFNWPLNAQDIGAITFSKCVSLETLNIPNIIKSIGSDVFYGCDKLDKIIFNGTKQEWRKINKNTRWRKESIISQIVCTDGIVKYNVD